MRSSLAPRAHARRPDHISRPRSPDSPWGGSVKRVAPLRGLPGGDPSPGRRPDRQQRLHRALQGDRQGASHRRGERARTAARGPVRHSASGRSSRPTATGTTSRRFPRCARPATRWRSPPGDAAMLPAYDLLIEDDAAISSESCTSARSTRRATPPGRRASSSKARPCCSRATPCFPGGPGNTTFPGGNFAQIITSIDGRLFAPAAPRDDRHARTRRGHDDRHERPHLEEWIRRELVTAQFPLYV